MKTATIFVLAVGLFASDVIATADQAEVPSQIAVQTGEVRTIGPDTTSMSASNWYNREVRTPDNAMIGSVSDVIRSPVDGSVVGLVVGVGPFLGTGERNVVLAIDGVSQSTRNNRSHLIAAVSRHSLVESATFKFDNETSNWIPVGDMNRPGRLELSN